MAILYDRKGNKIAVGGSNITAEEPMRNDIPCVYLTGILPVSKDEGELSIVLRYVSQTADFTDYATLKIQGDSSTRYAKKNFTVKLYKDSGHSEKNKRGFYSWKESNKFVLKANWIDHSHARNIVSARIWTNIVKSRNDYASLPTTLRENHMAVDGFPVKVFANGVYQGLYTWNVPKDALYGLDDDINENCLIQGDSAGYPDSELFRGTTVSGVWSDETHDSMPNVINTSWTKVLSFVSTSSDSDFVSKIGNYFDKQSLIDQYIYLNVGCILDNIGKNQTFFTYDAVTWYGGMYDMDGTWGLPPFHLNAWASAESVFQTDYSAVVDGNGTTNYLYERLGSLFSNDIKTRYAVLRVSVLSEDNIIAEFEKFIQSIPNDLYEEDFAETTGGGAFTGIPFSDTNNIQQIRKFVRDRLAYVDTVIEAL